MQERLPSRSGTQLLLAREGFAFHSIEAVGDRRKRELSEDFDGLANSHHHKTLKGEKLTMKHKTKRLALFGEIWIFTIIGSIIGIALNINIQDAWMISAITVVSVFVILSLSKQ